MKKYSIIGLIFGVAFGIIFTCSMRKAIIEKGITTTCKNGGCYLD